MLKISSAWDKKYRENPLNQPFHPVVKSELDDFIKLLKKGYFILDLGCGIGDKAEYLGKKGFVVSGVDSSKSAIAYGKEHFKKVKLYERSVLKTGFTDKSFDAVVSIAVFHCLEAKDRIKYVEEVERILKFKGLLFQLVLSSKDEHARKGELIEENTYLRDSGVLFHLFTKAEIKGYFKNFKVINFKEHVGEAEGKKNAVYTMILQKK